MLRALRFGRERACTECSCRRPMHVLHPCVLRALVNKLSPQGGRRDVIAAQLLMLRGRLMVEAAGPPRSLRILQITAFADVAVRRRQSLPIRRAVTSMLRTTPRRNQDAVFSLCTPWI